MLQDRSTSLRQIFEHSAKMAAESLSRHRSSMKQPAGRPSSCIPLHVSLDVCSRINYDEFTTQLIIRLAAPIT